MKKLIWMSLCAAMVWCGAVTRSYGESRLGVGANYWVALSSIDLDDVDESGFSYYLSYQYRGDHLLGLQADLEVLPDRFGKETAWAPQAYLVLGKALYAAAGLGVVYTDSSFADEPFFALKAGFDLEVFSGFYLDLNINYRFNDTTDLKDSDKKIDTDTLFLGAALRFGF